MTYVLTNLDFELTWSRDGSPSPIPRVVRRFSRDFQSILRLIAPDATPLPASAATGDFPAVSPGRPLLPWGWTPPVLRAAHAAGLTAHAPDLPLVQQLTSKLFSHSLEIDLGLAMDGATTVSSLDELRAATSAIPGPWLLKHPFGVSGRHQHRSPQGPPSADTLRWAQRHLANTPLVLEPLLDNIDEFSFHYELSPDAPPRFLGACDLHTSSGGTLRGLRPIPSHLAPQALRRGADLAADAASHLGYFGPLSVDTLRGQWQHSLAIRPLLEINPRFTFGRLAIALSNWLDLPPDDSLTWVHPPRADTPPPHGRPLPEEVDPSGASRTYLLPYPKNPRASRITST